MAKQQYYIGSTGPFYYDDGDTYRDGEGAGESQTAFYGLATAPAIFGSVKCISSITIGDNVDGADPFIQALGHANDSIIYWMEDEDYWKFLDDIMLPDNEKIILGTGSDMDIYYNGTNGYIHTDLVAASDLHVDCGTDKTVVLDEPVYDDIRITPGSFDRPGASDPTIKAVTPGGGAITSYLYEFADGNIASFTVQLPHSYKTGEDIKVHLHWTPGTRGNEENGNLVGWKVDYTWANIDGAFAAMATADLQDACNGVDWEHNMTPEVTIDGHTAAKGISSMLICNVRRTDTGTDDTWASSTTGQLPLLLEIDFHFPIDTLGSRDWGTK